MDFKGTVYRGHNPCWSFDPLSGEGARVRGGRFNLRGMPALYLSLSQIVALSEYNQGFPRRPQPVTLCAYEVDCTDIIDLTDVGERHRVGTTLAVMSSAWELFLHQKQTPQTWLLANNLVSDGVAGIIVPSFAANAPEGGKNLVLWDWRDSPPHQVRVIDDHGLLPNNQNSWRSHRKGRA